MKSHETSQNHQSRNNSGKLAQAGLFHPWSLGRYSDCRLDLGFNRMAVDSSGQSFQIEQANSCCLDPGCQHARCGRIARSSSVWKTRSGHFQSGPGVGDRRGERSQGVWPHSCTLGWDYRFRISKKGLGSFHQTSTGPELVAEVRFCAQKTGV